MNRCLKLAIIRRKISRLQWIITLFLMGFFLFFFLNFNRWHSSPSHTELFTILNKKGRHCFGEPLQFLVCLRRKRGVESNLDSLPLIDVDMVHFCAILLLWILPLFPWMAKQNNFTWPLFLVFFFSYICTNTLWWSSSPSLFWHFHTLK